jgi:uncharacterized membrane protein
MAKKKTAQKTTKTADVEENRQVAALSYIWVLVLIPLLTKRDSEFAQFHAKQGLILFIIEILAGFVFWSPIVGQLIALGLLIVAIVGAVKSLNGNWWKIPYIYEWSKKIKL